MFIDVFAVRSKQLGRHFHLVWFPLTDLRCINYYKFNLTLGQGFFHRCTDPILLVWGLELRLNLNTSCTQSLAIDLLKTPLQLILDLQFYHFCFKIINSTLNLGKWKSSKGKRKQHVFLKSLNYFCPGL